MFKFLMIVFLLIAICIVSAPYVSKKKVELESKVAKVVEHKLFRDLLK
jgi:hypothetical protein